ncbi:hypothetical protein PN498_06570, partial [Oscillatoria sp. CS-180]|uniref:hypothetical protein n=1 Tax=Oscillatoria sp. CS-180 TaxID=3021720 RepID=UPI00232BDD40
DTESFRKSLGEIGAAVQDRLTSVVGLRVSNPLPLSCSSVTLIVQSPVLSNPVRQNPQGLTSVV